MNRKMYVNSISLDHYPIQGFYPEKLFSRALIIGCILYFLSQFLAKSDHRLGAPIYHFCGLFFFYFAIGRSIKKTVEAEFFNFDDKSN